MQFLTPSCRVADVTAILFERSNKRNRTIALAPSPLDDVTTAVNSVRRRVRRREVIYKIKKARDVVYVSLILHSVPSENAIRATGISFKILIKTRIAAIFLETNYMIIPNIAHITIAFNVKITDISITTNISVQSALSDTSVVEITDKPQRDELLRNIVNHQNNAVAKC